MNKNLVSVKHLSLILSTLFFTYLCFWPVPISPIAWDAPRNEGFTGKFAPNNILSKVEFIPLNEMSGPEDLAELNNQIFAAVREGWIIKYNPKNGSVTKWVNTRGSPLGIVFDENENLIVADAYRGLLKISPNNEISVLTDSVNNEKILYADDVDITDDGKIIFSDASTKFSAKNGGTYAASLLDITEHGGHGRVLVYDPRSDVTQVLMSGLNFANGIAVSHEYDFFLVAETGSYKIHKYWLKGPKSGSSEIFIENLPGFPDNIVRGKDDRFWIGLVSPRNNILDTLSAYPNLRKVIQRFPEFLRPSAVHYSHVFAIDSEGEVIISLQDPKGAYHTNTGALETKDWLYISSLHAENLARLKKQDLDIQH